MEKRGGRKDVDPHMLRAHANNSKCLAEENGPDGGYDSVSASLFLTYLAFSYYICFVQPEAGTDESGSAVDSKQNKLAEHSQIRKRCTLFSYSTST